MSEEQVTPASADVAAPNPPPEVPGTTAPTPAAEPAAVAETEHVAEEVIHAAETAAKVFGLSDVAAELEDLGTSLETAVGAAESLVQKFGALEDNLKVHFGGLTPLGELTAAAAKVKSLVGELASVFKKP